MKKSNRKETKFALIIAFGTLIGTALASYSDYPMVGYVLVSNIMLVLYFGLSRKPNKCDQRIWNKIKNPFLP